MLLAGGSPCQATGVEGYLWPKSRGHVGSYSVTPSLRGPRNLTQALLWQWHHPLGRYKTTVVGGAIIDDTKNIYLATVDGIWKFSPDGRVLWNSDTRHRGQITCACSIMAGNVYSSTQLGVLLKLDMMTGREVAYWKLAASVPGDTGYVEAHGGIVVAGFDASVEWGGGAQTVMGVNASNGAKLWEFRPDAPSWNLQAQFSSDGQFFIFQDLMGKAYRMGTRDGRLVWKSQLWRQGSFADGGALLAGDRVFAIAATTRTWEPNTPGVLYAFRYDDGTLLWQRRVPRVPNSWPVAGPLRRGAKPSVVIPVGVQGGLPPSMSFPSWFPWQTRMLLHSLSLALGDYQAYLWEAVGFTATFPLDVVAFDAATGEHQWTWRGPVHRRVACGGDEEGFAERLGTERPICWPGPWTAPTMDAEGTIFVGAQNGELYALWDGDGDGKVDDATETSAFQTGSSALHPGPALVPGLLVYPTCDGLFVFQAPA